MAGTPPPQPSLPPVGWQHRLAAALTEYAARDERIGAIRVHGSAAAPATVDRWSDLDLLITARDPVAVAEAVVRELAEHHAPVFASSRGGGADGYTARLVLRDLRRVDITVAPADDRIPGSAPCVPPVPPAPAADVRAAIDPVVEEFRFDAVLAACKAARRDVLIGAHLTLGLARHILVAAMLLRDRDRGTAHHRHGGSRHDRWAARLASAPAPYDPAAITAAIRVYDSVLRDLLAEHGIGPRLDHGALPVLLDAVDRHVRDEHVRGGV